MLNLSSSEIPGQIQENLMAYMRLFAGLPGVWMRDAEAFWFVSGRRAPGDTILRARWPEEGVANDIAIEERIDELLVQVGEHVDEIGWMVFPGDQPGDLGRRLEA